jgi:hypothetical protein
VHVDVFRPGIHDTFRANKVSQRTAERQYLIEAQPKRSARFLTVEQIQDERTGPLVQHFVRFKDE